MPPNVTPPMPPIVTESAMNWGQCLLRLNRGADGCSPAVAAGAGRASGEGSTNMAAGSLPEERNGITMAIMHAQPSAKVPELAECLRRLRADVTVIVVESGERLNQQLSNYELHQAMTAEPTANELYRGFKGYLTYGNMFVCPQGRCEASFPIFFGPVKERYLA